MEVEFPVWTGVLLVRLNWNDSGVDPDPYPWNAVIGYKMLDTL